MADMVIVSDYAGELFGKKLAKRLMCQHVSVKREYFQDEEIDVQIGDNVRGREVCYVAPWFPDPTRRFTEIAFVNSALKYSSAARIIDVFTYLGFMKKDFKDRPRVPISIREVAESIERYAHRLLSIDPHSPQIQGVFRIPADWLDGSVLVAEDIKKRYELTKTKVVSPDIGAVKRSKILAERIGQKKLAIVYKMRDISTGETTAEDVIGDIDNMDIVFWDDQAVTLDSLCGGAKIAKERGANKIYAYCTHGLMVPKNGVSAEQRIRESEIEKLYITDTIPRPDSYFEENPKIELISCMELFAEALKRIHENRSVSELFR